MGGLDTISIKDLKELLCMGWMTHDGMWFYNVFQKFGGKTASDINSAAIQSMIPFEVSRLKKALGILVVDSYDALKEFVEGAFDLVGADFMQFNHSFPGNNIMRWDVAGKECFAYKGVKRIGALDDYNCGIFVRIDSWLKTLGIDYRVTPEVHGCLMHQGRRCYREYHLDFKV